MVRERPLRDAGGLRDVAHAGCPKTALVHESQPVGEQLFLVRRPWHATSMRGSLPLVKGPDQVFDELARRMMSSDTRIAFSYPSESAKLIEEAAPSAPVHQ